MDGTFEYFDRLGAKMSAKPHDDERDQFDTPADVAPPTLSEARAVVGIVTAYADAIREAGPLGLVNGHMFAALSGKMTYANHMAVVGWLKRAGLVVERHSVLYWTEWTE